MNVTHVISGLSTAAGGPVFAMAGQAQHQAKMDLRVRVASAWMANGARPESAVLSEAGVQIIPIGPVHTSLGWSSQTRSQLAPIIQDSDVVHIHALWEDILHQAAVLCRQFTKPYIFHPCGMLSPWSLRQSSTKKKIYWSLRLGRDLNSARAIHAATQWEREQMASLQLKPPVVVVPNGVDLREFEQLPPRGMLRQKFPQTQGKPLIVFLGRVFPGKGLEMLIPAMGKMQNRQAMLAAVGPDCEGYMGKMQALAQQHGVSDRVFFTGMMHGSERIAALVDADVFSLPSEHENFGVAILEAMAAGVPVVVSDQVGLCNEIISAGAGEAVPLDAIKLAKTLDEWLADEPRRREAGVSGRAVVFERFTWEPIVRQWNEVYRELSIG